MSFQLSRKTSATSKIEWVIPNLIVRNDVNLIDGRKSSGKSSVIAAILGQWHNTPQEVNWHKLRNILWLSSEEGFDTIIKPRLMQYGISEDQITTINYRHGGDRKPILPTDCPQFIDFLRTNKISALVIDPFSELKPSGWTINDGDQMRTYMTSLVSLCDQAECTAFAPRHMRKAVGSHAGDDGMGSVQIKASLRHALRIDATEEKVKRRYISENEGNIAQPLSPLQFGFKRTANPFGLIEWMGHQDISLEEIKKLAQSKVQRSKLEDAKRLLLEALAERPVSAKTLIKEAQDYGIGDRTLDEAKAALDIQSDRVINPDTGLMHWVWRIPEQPTASVASGTDASTTGEDDVKKTILDLPESNLPPDATLPDAGPVKPKRTRKPKPTPEATPAPEPRSKPKGKGKGKGTEK